MKKYLTSTFAITFITALTLSVYSTNVYADSTSTLTVTTVSPTTENNAPSDVTYVNSNILNESPIKSIDISPSASYYLFEDSTLWATNEEGDVVKIYDNVKSVQITNSSSTCIILNDNSLLYGYYFPGEDIDNTFAHIADDVKYVSETFEYIYILKNDNTLWKSPLASKYSSPPKEVVDEENIPDLNTSEEISLDETTVIEGAIAETAVEQTSTDTDLSITETSENTETAEISYSHRPNLNLNFVKVLDNVKKAEAIEGDVYVVDTNNTLSKYEAKNFTKTHMMDNVEDFVASYNSVLVKDTSDNLFEFQNTQTEISEPKLLFENVSTFNVSNSSYLLLDNNNTLWGMGNNNSGNLGIIPVYSETFEQVDTDVKQFSMSSMDSTIYQKTDGTLIGMGNNSGKQLGDIPYVESEYLDSEGKTLVASDVLDMDISSSYSAIIKEDNSLWKVGTQYSQEMPDDTEVVKIADDVKFANTDNGYFTYITGENNDLYVDNGFMFFNDEETYYNIAFGVLNTLGYETSGENKRKTIGKIVDSMSPEEVEKYYKLLTEAVDTAYTSSPIASVVKSVQNFYYLDNNNNFYKINISGEDELMATDIKDFSANDNYYVYTVTTDNELLQASLLNEKTVVVNQSFDEYMNTLREEGVEYSSAGGSSEISPDGTIVSTITIYTPKENLEFIPTGLNNVQSVKSFGYDLAVLDTNNTLNLYSKNRSAFNIEYEGQGPSIKIGDKKFAPYFTAENIKSFDFTFSSLAYINDKDELWVRGSNYEESLADYDVYGPYISEPVKIMDNVSKVALDHTNTLILTNDNNLYGRGQNENGQLGFKPQGYANRRTTVKNPTALNLEFVIKK